MNNRIGSPDSSSSAEDVKPLKKMAEEIKVVIRVRPLNDRETNPSFIKPSTGLRCWRVLNEHNAITQTLNDGITPLPEKISGRTIFTYDKVFGEKSTTRDIYDYAARGIVSMAVGGRNGSIFAYGQTSSGKTHTMQGSSTISKSGGGVKDGFVHLAADDLFHKISEQQGRDFKIQVSVIEVYNEDVRDLLVDPRSRKQKDNLLKIRENPQKGIFVDAVKKEAGSLSKLLSILSTGEKNRIVAKTTLNKRSSRSHLIFCIMLTSKPNNKGNGNGRPMSIEKLETSQVSTLNLIDLAGSESVRHRSSHSNEDRRKEGGNINKSLLTLSRVISALGQQQKPASKSHIGYRDSKLTRVLQPSLSGNAKLAFICCITASGLFLEETKSTLQFAQRIKHVKTASKINLKAANKNDVIKRMQDDLDDAKQSLAESLDKVHHLKNEIETLKLKNKSLTNERDRALKLVKIHEKKAKEKEKAQKNIRVPQDNTGGKPPKDIHSTKKKNNIDTNLAQTSGDIKALNEANNDIKNQVSFLAEFADQLQGRKTIRVNGMPSHVRTDSDSGLISEITEPTRYGTHIDEIDISHYSFLSEEQSKQSSNSSLISKGEFVQGESHLNVITEVLPT